MFAVHTHAAAVDAADRVSETTAIGFYAVYATIAIALVVWLARTLFSNGELFLVDVFDDDRLAGAVNRLLVIGFYLLNLGYALLLYQVDVRTTLTGGVNDLVRRLGLLLLSLGVIHLLNMFVFWRIRTYRDRQAEPTLPMPTGFMPPPPAATVTTAG